MIPPAAVARRLPSLAAHTSTNLSYTRPFVRHSSSTMPPTRTESPRALLLLPPAPSPPTYAALKAAYNAPLISVLQTLARSPQRSRGRAILDIAVPCPHLYGQLDAPRAPSYAQTQSLVAGLYKLICVIAAKNAIDTEDAEGVDARLLLLAHPRHGKPAQPVADTTPEQDMQGPVVSIYTLARSPRSWDTRPPSPTLQPDAHPLPILPASRTPPPNVQRVRGGIVTVEDEPPAPSESVLAAANYFSVAVGGTFDHMHIGHKLLLTMFAFVLATHRSHDPKVLTVGITGDELLKKKKYAEFLESWQDRQQAVHDFLGSIVYFGQPGDSRIKMQEINEPGPNGHAVHVTYPSGLIIKYVEIWDPFGPTITDESISALVLSLETKSGGEAVNKRRLEQGWGALDVFDVSVLDAGEEESVDETFQSKLSSTEIRRMRSERGQGDR